MQYYSLLELADMYGRPRSTTHRHLQELVSEGKFTKKSRGKYYQENEAREIAALLNFDFKPRTKKKAA